MDKLKLSNFKESPDEIHYFKISLLMVMGEEFYYLDNIPDLLFHSLNCIEDFENKVTKDANSIEEHCLIILKHFGFNEKESRETFYNWIDKNGNEFISKKYKLEKHSDRYLMHILQLEALP